MLVLATLGANALWLLYLWLASAAGAGEIAKRKGYAERLGLGTGLLLSAIGLVIWLFVPARPESQWAKRRAAKS